ncbi:hypothetical protein ACHAWT_008402 [Skeletonema menzelii]
MKMHGVFVLVLLASLLLATAFNANKITPAPSVAEEQPIGPIHTLILTRHGDSLWNGKYPGCRETFTGWSDVPLSPIGEQEAIRTGELLTKYTGQVNIDAMFTSTLIRAKMTAHHCYWAYNDRIQEKYRSQKHYQYYNFPNDGQQNQKSVASKQQQFQAPAQFIIDYRLNERHYGSLQGIVKAEAELGLHGHSPEDVYQWRRSWHAVPPQLNDDDPRRLEEIRKYGAICGEEKIPKSESLQMVAHHRIRPFLEERLTPILDESYNKSKSNKEEGGTALVVAHANSLRALIGVICNIEQQCCKDSDESLRRLEAMKIPTASPLILQYRKTSKKGYYCPVDGLQQGEAKNELPVYPLSTLPLLRSNHRSYPPNESAQALESSLAEETMVMSS